MISITCFCCYKAFSHLTDSNLKDQTNQVDGSQLPVNMMQPHMSVMQPPVNAPHPPVGVFPYPVGLPAPMMNMQRNPFTMHPPMPLHLHTGVPLMQVAAPASIPQGPPPPPPPPPSQQVSYVASQPDGKQVQVGFQLELNQQSLKTE
jgi:hypothetical protein